MRIVKNSQPIIVVIVCDNNLVVMLSALLKSIETTHFGSELIHIYIVEDGISKKNKSKLNATVMSNKLHVFWKSVEEIIPENMHFPLDMSTYPKCIYARLFIAHFLPDAKKAIYLDADMIVLKDIRGLWDVTLGDHIIGAVQDRAKVVSSPWGGIKNYKELGLNSQSKYFNSGLLVLNLELWRRFKCTENIIQLMEANKRYLSLPDQYGLNLAFVDNWFEIDRRWNCDSQSTEIAPFLIHFTMVKPIFRGYDTNKKYIFNPEYKDLFYKILAETPWHGFQPKRDSVRYKQKLWNVIKKKQILNSIISKVKILNNNLFKYT